MPATTIFGDKVETDTTIFGDPIEPFDEEVAPIPDPVAEDKRIKETLDFSEKSGMNPSVTAEYHDSLEKLEKKKPIGFLEGITENALFKIPISGPLLEGLDLARIKLASIRLNTPDFDWEQEAEREKRRLDWEYGKPGLVTTMNRQEYLDRRKAITAESARQDDIDGVTGYITAMAEREERGYNFWGRVGQGLSVLPAWMFEFALTGGLYRTGSAGVKKLLQRHAKSKLLAKTSGWIVGSAVRTTVGMPQRTFANTMRRSLNNDEGWATSIAKGWGETFIEVASEQAGRTITGGLSYVASGAVTKMPFGSKFLSALQRAWVKLSPNNTAAKFAKKIATKAGYSNLIGEYGEERLATLMHGIVGTETFGLPDGADTFDRVLAGVKQDLQLANALSEVVVLSVPGAIKVSVGQLGKFANDSKLRKAIEKDIGVSPEAARKAVEIKNGEGGIEEADKYLSDVKTIGEKAAEKVIAEAKAPPTEAIPAPEKPVAPITPEKAVEVAPEGKQAIIETRKQIEDLSEKGDLEGLFNLQDKIAQQKYEYNLDKAIDATTIRLDEPSGRYVIISPSAKQKGKWQLTKFDKAGPFEDTTRDTKEEALELISGKRTGGLDWSDGDDYLVTDTSKLPIVEAEPTKVAKPKAAKEIKDVEKETITEPPESPKVDTGKARKFVPTGELDPTNAKEALEITKHHAQWVAGATKFDPRNVWEGIRETKTEWDEKEGVEKIITTGVEYTPEQIDTAYRTIQKPVPSPMPDTDLFAMPGKEAQMKAIAQKMAKVKGVVKPKKMGPKALTKPTALPKAKTKKEDHIKAVYVAAAKESERYNITGIKVEGDTLIATDGRRMFVAKGKWGKDGLYLDVASLKKGSLGKPTKEKINFPRWREIVPEVSKSDAILVDLEAALTHVRQAAIVTTEESKGITVIENKDSSLGLGFAAAAPEVGHAEINIEPGGRILGAVNPRYLLDAIRFHAIRGDTVIEFYFKNFDRPILTKSLDGKTSTVTMPINVGEPSEAIKKAISEWPIKAEPAKVSDMTLDELKKESAVFDKTIETEIARLDKIAPGRQRFAETGIEHLSQEDAARMVTINNEIARRTGISQAEAQKRVAEKRAARAKEAKPPKPRTAGFLGMPVEFPEPEVAREIAERIYQNYINRFASIENAVKKAKKFGLDVLPGEDPALRARSYLGLGRKVEVILEKNTYRTTKQGNVEMTGEGLKPILDSYENATKTLEPSRKKREKDFNDYLIDTRTVEDLQRKAFEGAKKNIASKKQVAEAQERLDKLAKDYGEKGVAIFEEHAQRLYEYQKRVLHLLVDAGNLSQKQFNQITELNQHYIPFDRIMDEQIIGGVPIVKKRFTKARAPIGRIKGSELEVEDTMESIIKNTYRIVDAADRNAVAANLAKLAGTLPDKISPVRVKMIPIRIDPKEILTVSREFRSQSSKIMDEVRTITEEGGVNLTGPAKKLEKVVKDALTHRGFSEAEANSFVLQIKKGEPITGEGITKETLRQTIRETQHIIITQEPVESIIFRPSQFAPKGKVIEYFVKGKRKYVDLSGNLFDAMTGLNETSASVMIKVLAKPAHWLKVGATITPEFIAKNPIRDQWTALMQTSFGFTPFVDPAGAVADIIGKSDIYNEWLASGGAYSGFVELNRPALKKSVKELRKPKIRKLLGKLNIISDAQDLSQLMEMATRLGAFKAARRKGLTGIEAGFESREASIDFARRGAKMGDFNRLMAFFNAGVQGLDKTVRTTINHPYQTAVKGIIAITIPTLLLYLRNRKEEDYVELAQWKKDLFWNFKIGDNWWRVPKPFLFGQLFGSIPERFFEFADTKDAKAFDDLSKTVIDSLTPVSGDPEAGLLFTALKPIIENMANWNFFLQRPIVPRAKEGLLPPEQFTRYTSETAKQLGRWINYSPAKIENLVRGYFGGTGQYALKGTDVLINGIRRAAGEKVMPKRPKQLADIPLVKSFIHRPPTGSVSRSVNDFYESTDVILKGWNTIRLMQKEGRRTEIQGLLATNPEIRLHSSMTKFRTKISELNKRSDIILKQDISTEIKIQKIRKIDDQKLELAKKANDMIHKAQEKAQ